MAQSFWKLLEQKGEPMQFHLLTQDKKPAQLITGDRFFGSLTDEAVVSGFQGNISCNQGPITFSYFRNDHLDNVGPGKEPLDYYQCGDICNPWWDAYAEHASTTLLMVNTGVHHH